MDDNYPYRKHGLLSLRTPAEIVAQVDLYITAHPDRLDEVFVAHVIMKQATPTLITNLLKAGWRMNAGHHIGADLTVPVESPYIGTRRVFSIDTTPLNYARAVGDKELTALLTLPLPEA